MNTCCKCGGNKNLDIYVTSRLFCPGESWLQCKTGLFFSRLHVCMSVSVCVCVCVCVFLCLCQVSQSSANLPNEQQFEIRAGGGGWRGEGGCRGEVGVSLVPGCPQKTCRATGRQSLICSVHPGSSAHSSSAGV